MPIVFVVELLNEQQCSVAQFGLQQWVLWLMECDLSVAPASCCAFLLSIFAKKTSAALNDPEPLLSLQTCSHWSSWLVAMVCGAPALPERGVFSRAKAPTRCNVVLAKGQRLPGLTGWRRSMGGAEPTASLN
jgi:hypothetical protein